MTTLPAVTARAPTSATGDKSDDVSDLAVAHTVSPMRGFTLIELVVALSIVALLAGASAVAYPRFHQSMEYRAAVRGVLGGMSAARTEALKSGSSAVFFVDLANRSYGVGDKVSGRFPDTVEVRFIVAEREVERGGRGGIRFHADGGATGGSVDLMRPPDGAGVRIRVDWLLGRISQEPLS